jgi:BirA family biotin operon repressor/biotin-[acetyl-CoA-carboxylase] ligase
MFSCGFLPQIPARHLAGLAPAFGIAACDALRQLAGQAGQRLQMKWPNDLMIDDAKLAGILVESRIRGHQLFIVAGIGLNLENGAQFRSELNREVTDWASLKSEQNARIDIAATIAQSWLDCMNNYNPDKLQGLIKRLESFDYLHGKSVNAVQDHQILMSGTACGMGPDASLQIRLSDGSMRSVTVGDVSVRTQR